MKRRAAALRSLRLSSTFAYSSSSGSLMTAGSRSSSSSSSSSVGSRGGTELPTRLNQVEMFSGSRGVISYSRWASDELILTRERFDGERVQSDVFTSDQHAALGTRTLT